MFFSTRFAINILDSYSRAIGIPTIIWLIKSGGVIIAANIRIQIIACFRYFFRNLELKIPSFVNKYEMIGKRNNIPEKKTVDSIVLIYELIVKILSIFVLILYDPKNWTVRGATTKYPKDIPKKNNEEI